MVDDIDFRLLRYFVAVAEDLHFTRAAQRLFVAQQALTPARLLTVARERAPEVEFFARFHGGLQTALPLLATHRLHVAFGRLASLGTGVPDAIAHRLVRLERIAVLLPEDHRLAALSAVPLAALRDAAVCWRAGNHATPDWEHAALQLLAQFGVDPMPAHPHVHGLDELAFHIRRRNAPVLTVASQPQIPGAVVRPLVEPSAVYPWHMIWNRDLRHRGLQALHTAIDDLAATERWLEPPDDAWLPEPEAGGSHQPALCHGENGVRASREPG